MLALKTPPAIKHLKPVAPDELIGDKIQPGRPLFGIVWINRERVSGTPCYFGTRVPIKTLFDCLSHGDTMDGFLDGFEGVDREQAEAALGLAGERWLGDLEHRGAFYEEVKQ
jgi:uncharacterized protein (DUF433 family)